MISQDFMWVNEYAKIVPADGPTLAAGWLGSKYVYQMGLWFDKIR